MSTSPLVSVVIPSWNGLEFLDACLTSLARQRFDDFEVIVVDNASDDGSVDFMRQHFPTVRVLALLENLGFAGAVNAGARSARGTYIAVLNSDTEVDPEWLAELVACLERHPRAASIASKVLRLDDDAVLDGAGDSMTRSLKAYRRGWGEVDRGQYDTEDEVFSASGTACLWRADVFRELGGFDASFFAYYDDVDLGFRARLAGYESWYAPRAVVGHVGHGTSQLSWRAFESLHSVRNRWATIVKDAPASWLLRNWHRLLAGEVMSISRALVNGDLRLHIQAYGQAGRLLAGWRGERRQIQSQRSVGYEELRQVAKRSLPPLGLSFRRLITYRSLSSKGVVGSP